MNPVLMSLLLVVALTLFSRTMIKKLRLLAALQPDQRLDRIFDRLKAVVVMALGQKRLVGRKAEWTSGIMHAFIFWGFCVLLIRSITLYGQGYVKTFELPLFNQAYLSGYLYLALKDFMEGVVLIMAAWAVCRRVVLQPKRLHNTWEAYFVLAMIVVLMVSDLLLDGARYNLVVLFGNPGHLHFFDHPRYGNEFLWTPVSVAGSALISQAGPEANSWIMSLMFWVHIVTQLIFLNFLPLGKHFHVITALPNVFFSSLNYPHDKPKWLDLEDETAWEDESLGMNHIHQLTWKQGLDLYTCTECGRCKDVCPAYLTDKPLNLKDFNDDLKHELFANADKIVARAGLASALKQTPADEKEGERLKGELAALTCDKALVGNVIREDTLWACTTCRACEEVCPVTIEHVPRIIAMRQGQTLMAENYPRELNIAFKGLERNGNPWGIGYDKRADWAQGLDVKTLAQDPDVDYLLWVGCVGSYGERAKKVSVALVNILNRAGVSFGILGTEEKCTGEFARKVGNEMLFQMMAQDNIEVLNRYKVKKIITACPHCLNTLKHEYPQNGGNYEVIHHSQFIDQLVKEKRIKLNRQVEGRLTYHDPCYLGRYNSVYQAPRSLLNAVSTSGLMELSRSHKESFCCGAGGGRMWMEESIGRRINLERSVQIDNLGVSLAAVGCPFCLTMIEDGMKELEKEEDIRVMDIAELVEKALI